MAIFNGTDAGEVIVGTAVGDEFNLSKGQDYLDGAEGVDSFFADLSAGTDGGFFVSGDLDGLTGYVHNSLGHTTFVRMEHVSVIMTSGDNGARVEYNGAYSGYTTSVDGGAGWDYLTLYPWGSQEAFVGSAAGGISSASFTFLNFEQFDLKLGGGNDNLALGSRNDR